MDELNKITTFLQYDLKLKKLMVDCAPDNSDDLVSASDEISKALKDMEIYLIDINKLHSCINESEVKVRMLKLQTELAECDTIDKLKKFYRVKISDISSDFIDKVNTQSIGYYPSRSLPINEAESINEILHAIHHDLVNDEKTYDNLPLIAEKNISEDERYKLKMYGNKNSVADAIFDMMSPSLGAGETKFLTINENEMIMMVKDKGYATTLEIEKEQDKYYVNYFIPKITDVDYVNVLPGVRQITLEDRYTTGVFETTVENLPYKVASLIASIPDDFQRIGKVNR